MYVRVHVVRVHKNNNSGEARSPRDNYDLARIYAVYDEENGGGEERDMRRRERWVMQCR